VAWRDDALWQLKSQIIKFKGDGYRFPIDKPICVSIHYWTKDKHRRDAPSIIDALWHVLEKAGIVTDDRYLGGEDCTLIFNHMGIDKDNPHILLDLWHHKETLK